MFREVRIYVVVTASHKPSGTKSTIIKVVAAQSVNGHLISPAIQEGGGHHQSIMTTTPNLDASVASFVGVVTDTGSG
jgi:hypothetical protein